MASMAALSMWSCMSAPASRHSATTTSWGSYSRSDGSCVSKWRTPNADSHTALDVSLDHGGRVRNAVDVHQADVREVARVVVPAGDERRRRIAAPRHEDVAGADLHAVYARRRCGRGLAATLEEGKATVGMLH